MRPASGAAPTRGGAAAASGALTWVSVAGMNPRDAYRILSERLPADPSDNDPIPVPPAAVRALLPGPQNVARLLILLGVAFLVGRASK